MQQENLNGTDYSIDRYADAIINGKPEHFDAIEVQGVRTYQTGADSFSFEVDNENPTATSVYVHVIDGGVACVGDFTHAVHAQQYAAELAEKYGWPVRDFTKQPETAEAG